MALISVIVPDTTLELLDVFVANKKKEIKKASRKLTTEDVDKAIALAKGDQDKAVEHLYTIAHPSNGRVSRMGVVNEFIERCLGISNNNNTKSASIPDEFKSKWKGLVSVRSYAEKHTARIKAKRTKSR